MTSDLSSTLFNIKLSTAEPRSGSLLVAEPFLKEECFNHAVILLVDHGDGYASMGLTLNKHTGLTLGQVTDDVKPDCQVPIYAGGPVGDNRMFYLHTLPDIFDNSIEVTPGLYIGGEYNQVLDYVNEGYPTDGLLRFYVGYSGWEPGQLNEEIEKNVWAVAQPGKAQDLLTGCDDQFWHRTVRSMGLRYRGWQFHPMDPHAN